jgi:ribosome assembly protein YihI (activator of Der GTPase)
MAESVAYISAGFTKKQIKDRGEKSGCKNEEFDNCKNYCNDKSHEEVGESNAIPLINGRVLIHKSC